MDDCYRFTVILVVCSVLFSTTFSRSEEAPRQHELPRIRTHNGVLYVEASGSGNGTISLMASAIKVGNNDLIRTIDDARRIPEMSKQLDRVLASLGMQQNDSDASAGQTDSTRYPVLESGNFSQLAQENSRKLQRMQRKLNRVESRLSEVITALNRDECSAVPCRNEGTCIDKYNGFTCLCEKGWEGATCDIDKDECALVNGTDLECKNNGTCVNTRGSYRCDCPPAWHGIHCTIQKNDCTGSSNTEICGHGTCLSVARTAHDEPSYSCLCDAGWTKANSSSAPCDIDINECTVSKPPCSTDPKVNCINTPGTFRCAACPPGYEGNGIVCTDTNECLTNNGGCSRDPLVTCYNTVGSFFCGGCPYGYTGDGVTCTPYGNNCMVNNGGCSPNAVCTNSMGYGYGYSSMSSGSVMCTCKFGYTGSGVGPFGCTRSTYQPYIPYDGSTSGACASSPCENGGVCHENSTSSVVVSSFSRSRSLSPSYWCACVPPWSGQNCDSYDTSCGGNLSGPSGRFSSPRDPTGDGEYAHNANCRWEITAAPGEVVWLKFLQFQLEHHGQCRYDYVEIIDPLATDNTKNGSLGKICGKDQPLTFTSSSNKMIVTFITDASVHYNGFMALYTTLEASKICGGEIRQSSGVIRSPQYPENYPAFSSCTWVIAADEGHQIVLNITNFNLEQHDDCQADYLEIRNGGSESSPLMKKMCGTQEPMQIKSHANRLFVRFVSDRFRSAPGFVANYYTSATGCNGVMRAPFGAITSPNYPTPYAHNTECYWHIHAAAGSHIQASVVDLDLENSIGCKYDYLKFFDGSTSTIPAMETYCGTTIPQAPIKTTSNEMNIKFRSDLSSHGRGFHVTYQSVCSGRQLKQRSGVIESPGFPESYPPETKCDYRIEVPKGNKINVTFSHFGMPGITNGCGSDNLSVFDGESEAGRNIGMYCGATPPQPFQSTGNFLYIKFVSDATTSGTGFRLEWITHGCGGDILVDRTDNAIARYITSPKYPNPYPPNMVCEWKLTSAEYGYGIKLDIMDIDMEPHGNCRWDKLEIFNGPSEKSPTMTTLCHSQNKTQTMTSSSPFLYIKFQSDQSKAGTGFKARYSVVESICGGNFSTPKGAIQSKGYPGYEQNWICGWLITVAEQHVVVLNISTLNIDKESPCETEYLAAYDGEGIASPLLFKDCGNKFAESNNIIIRSNSNKMFLEFRTNNVTDSSRTGFKAEYSTGCGAVLAATETSEEFISPNFPSRYSKSLNCSYVIRSQDPNTRVFLQFVFMDIEERSNCTAADYLQVRNGDNANAPLIGNFCGRKIPPAIISSGNALYVRFITNDWKEEAGWSATYSNTLSSCGGELLALEGHFVSPNYPSNYLNEAECVWTIKASPGNTIDLNFQSFNLGNKMDDPYCNLDYVEVREESASGNVLGRFCGNQAPDNLTSGVGTLWVMFRSSVEDTHPGFMAEYKLRHGGEIVGKTNGQIASPLYPMNYPHNSSFTWRVTTTAGYTIVLRWLRMDMEDRRCYFDYVAVYNGPSMVYPLIGKYCGFELPEPVQTTSNQVYIVMNTDRYGGNGQGFLIDWEAISPQGAPDRSSNTALNAFTFELQAKKTPQRIMSPGYPTSVMPNMTYDWKLRTDETSHIELTMLNISLGRRQETYCHPEKPWLQITEGTTYRTGRTVTNICGVQDGERTYKAATNSMRLLFITGPNPDSLSATGFSLTYQSVCGANIYSSTGQIQSDGYPQPDANGNVIDCMWNVTADFGQTLDITFDDFELSPQVAGDCSQHYVSILNGFSGDISPSRSQTFCGTTIPAAVQTRTNRFQVRYYKSASVTSATRGFSLKYRATRFACGGELKLTDFVRNGIFHTPNYPANYPSSIECEWIIVAPGGDRIRLDFVDKFELERPNNNACPWDYAEVRDGATPDAALIGSYCGTNRPGTLRSRSNVMYVKFRSDRGLVHTGFKANYSISTCGGTIVDQSGSVTNPHYPQSYPVGGSYDCEWYIQVPAGHFINFEVRDFRLPSWSFYNCSNSDFIEIRDYNSTGKVIKRLCGQQIVQNFSSSDSVAHIRFKTSPTTASQTPGLTSDTIYKFRILFTSNSESCGGTLTTSSGTITSPGFPNSYPNNRVCEWLITATPGRRILLEILDFEVEGFGFCASDFFEVYNGILPESPKIERLCGSKLAITNRIQSSMHYMKIKFQTDSSRTSRGFRVRYSSLEAATCGGTLTGLSGVITSPGFSSTARTTYQANEECIWTITNVPALAANDPSTINLQFTDLDTETLSSALHGSALDSCRSDFVEIRAGQADSNTPVQTVCGLKSNLHIDSLAVPGHSVWIRFRTDYSQQMTGFRLVYNISNCGGIQNTLAGWILSPGYPTDNYPSNLHCAWLIQSPGKVGQIQLTVRDIELENSVNCSKDSLEVLNGQYHTSPSLSLACGTKVPEVIRSQGPYLFVKFKSDAAGAGRGFKATFTTLTNGCGGTFHGNTGFISTPGYSDKSDYPESIECVWDIIVDGGYHISFTFYDRFDIQTSDGCLSDYVELRDPTVLPTDSRSVLGRYCGHDTPNATFSTSNRLRVKFRSDETTAAKGFTANWTIGCGGRLTDGEGTIVSPGFPDKPDNNLLCRWEIVADPSTPNIRLEFDPNHFDIEGSRRLMLKESSRSMGYQMEVLCHDYIIVYGQETDNESLAISVPPKICGSEDTDIPQPIYSQNKMIIYFYTDFALAGNGFKLYYKTQQSPNWPRTSPNNQQSGNRLGQNSRQRFGVGK